MSNPADLHRRLHELRARDLRRAADHERLARLAARAKHAGRRGGP